MTFPGVGLAAGALPVLGATVDAEKAIDKGDDMAVRGQKKYKGTVVFRKVQQMWKSARREALGCVAALSPFEGPINESPRLCRGMVTVLASVKPSHATRCRVGRIKDAAS